MENGKMMIGRGAGGVVLVACTKSFSSMRPSFRLPFVSVIFYLQCHKHSHLSLCFTDAWPPMTFNVQCQMTFSVLYKAVTKQRYRSLKIVRLCYHHKQLSPTLSPSRCMSNWSKDNRRTTHSLSSIVRYLQNTNWSISSSKLRWSEQAKTWWVDSLATMGAGLFPCWFIAVNP